MGRKSKTTKDVGHVVTTSSRLEMEDPSVVLRRTYDKRQQLCVSEIISSLESMATLIGKHGWMHPTDLEVFWLILGDLSARDSLTDEHLLQISRLVDREKLYHHIGYSCT